MGHRVGAFLRSSGVQAQAAVVRVREKPVADGALHRVPLGWTFRGRSVRSQDVEAADADDGLHGTQGRRRVLGGAAVERRLGAVLTKRRDAIGRTYLTAINPIVDPRLDSAGQLTFRNAAVDAGFAEAPTGYHVSWFRFDNATSATRLLARTDSAM